MSTTLTPNYRGYTSSKFEIYVASLSDYNSGILHGVYIDVEGTTEDVAHELIAQMLKDSPTTARTGELAEEYAIHDTSIELVDGLEIGEGDDIGTIYEAYDVIRQVVNKGYDAQAVIDYADNISIGRLSDIAINGCDKFIDAYQGQFRSEEDFAEHLADEDGLLDSMPENLRGYFDYERFARDLFISDYWRSNNGYVFTR